jgi:hypothetical protein
MPSLMNDFFQASRLETSGALSDTTFLWLTIPTGYPAVSASATETPIVAAATTAKVHRESHLLAAMVGLPPSSVNLFDG